MNLRRSSRYAIACLLAGTMAALVAVSASAMPQLPLGDRVLAGTGPESLLGTPAVPLSVSVARPFTVTGSLSPGHADEIALACYRRDAAGWTLARTITANVTTPSAGPQFSAEVQFAAAGTWVVRAETGGAEPSVSATSSEIRVSIKSDEIVWNRDGVLTLPEKMSYRLGAQQLIVATAASLKSRTGTVAVYEYRAGDWVELFRSPSRFGRNGLCAGDLRRRGNGKTPTGIWRMPDYVFGQRARKPSDVKLAYRHIGPHSWWSSEKGSHYNTWFTAHRRVDGEHLIDYRVAYEYALSTGYNAKPNTSVYGRGSGIFLHVWQGATTSGCVSVPLATMQRVFRTMDPAKRRVFVIGTLGANDPTRVDRY